MRLHSQFSDDDVFLVKLHEVGHTEDTWVIQLLQDVHLPQYIILLVALLQQELEGQWLPGFQGFTLVYYSIFPSVVQKLVAVFSTRVAS